MIPFSLMLTLVAADPDDGLAKRMLPVYLREAGEYSIAVESDPKKLLELKKEPVFEWSNPVRSGLQQGVVFAQVLPPGVYVAMNGKHFDWDRVRKNRNTGVFEATE